ncbi:MAG: hypothetical protein ACKVS9_09485 [Phycisphaerae bacterium]
MHKNTTHASPIVKPPSPAAGQVTQTRVATDLARESTKPLAFVGAPPPI